MADRATRRGAGLPEDEERARRRELPPALPPDLAEGIASEDMRGRREEAERFLLIYRSAIDEVATKVRILEREFTAVHAYNPIESYSTRLKSMPSLIAKARRRGLSNLDEVRTQITDVAGARVICSFLPDVYRVRDMLCGQDDITVRETKDYIASPKPNGYRSLHMIVEVPVFLSRGAHSVPVELQFRTIAMDFWASLEHKIYYKYQRAVPEALLAQLHQAAETAAHLDADMERLRREIASLPLDDEDADPLTPDLLRAMIELAVSPRD